MDAPIPPPDEETLYALPPATAATWGAWSAAAALVLGVGWLASKALRSTLAAVLALAVLVVLAVVPAVLDRRRLRRARSVVVDHPARTLRIDHGFGRVTSLPLGELTGAVAEVSTASEGVSLDVVTVTREGGERTTFVVLDRACAEGIVAALTAVLRPPSERELEG